MPFESPINAPYAASYAAPLVNFGPLGELPEEAFKATQRARTLQLQAPVIDPRTGQPTTDPNLILQAIAQRGGLEATASQLPMIQRQDYLNRLRSFGMGEEPASAPPAAGAVSTGAAGSPAALRPQAQAQPPAQTAQPPAQAPPAEISMQGNGTFENPYFVRSQADYNQIENGAYYRASTSTAPVAKGYEGRRPPTRANQTDGEVHQPTEEGASPANAANNGPNGRPTQVAGTGKNASFNERYAAAGPPFMAGSINAPAGGATSGAGAPISTPVQPQGIASPPSTVAGPSGPIASPPTQPPTQQAQAETPSQERFYSPGAAAVLPESYRGQPLKYLDQQERIATSFDMRAQEAEILGYPVQGFRDQAAAARNRANKARDAMIADNALTPELKAFVADRKPGETLAAYNARAAGQKAAETAPYDILVAGAREGGRPITVAPNQVVTTGTQVNPALKAAEEWAAKKLGIGLEGAPGNPAGAPANGAAPPQGQSAFTPRLVRNPDGSLASTVTPSTEEIQKVVAQDYEKKHEAFNGAQTVKFELANMESAARDLSAANWSSMGTGAEARIKLAKAANTVWSVLGVKGQDLPFDPNEIASWERLVKDTFRLGAALSRSIGGREPGYIVQQAVKANPNIESSELGFRMVLNSIRENAQHDSDAYEFATNFAKTHGGDLVGADIAFNKLNPPELYSRRAIAQAVRNIPQDAIEDLRANPKLAPEFDRKYGGDGLSKMWLRDSRGTTYNTGPQ